jgi:hypothetical protein
MAILTLDFGTFLTKNVKKVTLFVKKVKKIKKKCQKIPKPVVFLEHFF